MRLAESDIHLAYTVVVNPEEQYSIWLADREVPRGWRGAGFQGTREACLEWIAAVWTDMRPLTLRQAMRAQDTGEIR